MTAVPENIFAGMKDAKSSIRANYVRPGHYWALLNASKVIKTRAKGWAVVNEMICLKIFSDGEGFADGRCHREGEEFSHMMLKMHDSFLGNMKAFIKGVLQVDSDEDIDDSVCWEITGEEQPLSGLVVELRVVNVTTREGNPFTAPDYVRPVTADELEEELSPELVRRFFPDNGLAAYRAREEQMSND